MFERIGITERSMSRKMVGWICYAGDYWEDRGRRMSARVASCLNVYPLKNWSALINEARSDQTQSSVHLWTRYYNNLITYRVPVGLHQGPSPRT